MFEKMFKKTESTEMKNMPESFKDFDYFMKQGMDAAVLDSDELSVTYEVDTDISVANWYGTLATKYPELSITSTEGAFGKFEVTVAVKETAEASNEDELV